jgi:hypothetical protein
MSRRVEVISVAMLAFAILGACSKRETPKRAASDASGVASPKSAIADVQPPPAPKIVSKTCKAAGGGPIVWYRKDGFAREEPSLSGVITVCSGGPTGITLRIGSTTAYALRETPEEKIPWRYLQPIDIDGVTVRAGKTEIPMTSAYGGSQIGYQAENGTLVAHLYHGWVKTIGPFPDRYSNGKKADWYSWPLIRSDRELELIVPKNRKVKFAILFASAIDTIKDVFIESESIDFSRNTP